MSKTTPLYRPVESKTFALPIPRIRLWLVWGLKRLIISSAPAA
jgi:hypothetical protein